MRVMVMAIVLALAGCNRVGMLTARPPVYAMTTTRADAALIRCVQTQWAARGAALATVATPAGVRITARSPAYSTRLFATAEIVAFRPENRLTVWTTRRSRAYAALARVCA